MLKRRTDVSFEPEASGRILPFLIALMVFLAALGLAVALALNGSIAHWNQSLSGKLTVQILPSAQTGTGDLMLRAQAARDLLLQTEGVASATILPRADIEALLEPWLGQGTLGLDLPIPPLIDVSLVAGARPDIAALATRLAREVPGAELDDHKLWLDKLIRLARSVQIVAGTVVLMIGLAAVAVVIFATRADLATHHDTIEILHLIGARDSYIARQFQGRALGLGLRGGLFGLAVALLTFFVVAQLAGELDAPFLPRPDLAPGEWAAVAALPLAAAAIATLTARITVMRALRRIL